jgi:hypothetical protein
MTELRAILGETARPLVRVERSGKDNRFTNLFIGQGAGTAVSVDAGEISSKVQWGVHGTDAQISSDIAEHIICFEISEYVKDPRFDEGSYTLRNRSGQILAEAISSMCNPTMSKICVRGKERADVVKLFEQIRAGETAPESAGGRRGLIRSLRQREEYLLEQCHSLTDVWGTKVGELVLLQVSFDSLSSTNVRLERRIAELERENAELKKPKGFWQTFFRDFRKAYDAQVA